MEDRTNESLLLDTPKRISLQSQADQIRAALKDFERTFAANNGGRKPSKDEIKIDAEVAIKYKQYNKIRDVLSGKSAYAALVTSPVSPSKRQKHQRIDSGLSWSPKKKSLDTTPRRPERSSHLDTYETPHSVTPRPILLSAIGPTPQRDGRVLGLFDLLSNSGHSSKPTSSIKKRKLDALMEELPQESHTRLVAQTPSQRKRGGGGGDVLEYLTGTPETGHRKHSKTPVSEGRKFMLSQFFATPSAIRFSAAETHPNNTQTPLRDQVLGTTPKNQLEPSQMANDVTPAYLRRSTSFKDRLLSASRPGLNEGPKSLESPPLQRTGPPTLRHLRSIPKLFQEPEPVSFDEDRFDDEDYEDYEDDIEALREMEDNSVNILVGDSQLQSPPAKAIMREGGVDNSTQQVNRVWKKRGQKRTTRRAVMRPTQAISADAPKFVSAENRLDDEDEEVDVDISQVEETQIEGQIGRRRLEEREGISDDKNYVGPLSDESCFEKNSSKKPKKPSKEKENLTAGKSKKKTPTINPNAVSHMNFRTLKIKNKNSKANGRGKFGRGRR